MKPVFWLVPKFEDAWEYATCHHPNNMILNVVTGKQIPKYKYCAAQRTDGPGGYETPDSCCHAGHWFQARTTSMEAAYKDQ
jgi:hypothetical protein